MMPSMAHVGAYIMPTGVFTFCVHLEPAAGLGSNSQISLVDATLISNPPRMYSLLLATVNPPGKMVPVASPGQSSLPRRAGVSVAGSYVNTRAVAVVFPAAEPPTQ